MSPRIDVLLSTYQGVRFLGEQLESIFAQPRPGLRLLVRDDGSSDETFSLLTEYATARPEVTLLEDREHLGICASYSRLLQRAVRDAADYVLFCDQDDVWLPGRLERMLARILDREKTYGRDVPILVHSDLMVTDESLRPISPSFWSYQGLDPRRGATINRLLVQNVVTGAATIFNAALARRAVPISAGVVAHDWWMALVAACLGRLEALDEPTVLYRQHGANQVGAKRWGLAYILRRLAAPYRGEDPRQPLLAGQRQAAVLLERFGPQLTEDHRRVIAAYASLRDPHRGFLERRLLLLRHGIVKTGWVRNLGLFFRI
jgi:glycosyltransferase involved in cell wall biosynthesis